jgi:hypothetical protein
MSDHGSDDDCRDDNDTQDYESSTRGPIDEDDDDIPLATGIGTDSDSESDDDDGSDDDDKGAYDNFLEQMENPTISAFVTEKQDVSKTRQMKIGHDTHDDDDDVDDDNDTNDVGTRKPKSFRSVTSRHSGPQLDDVEEQPSLRHFNGPSAPPAAYSSTSSTSSSSSIPVAHQSPYAQYPHQPFYPTISSQPYPHYQITTTHSAPIAFNPHPTAYH